MTDMHTDIAGPQAAPAPSRASIGLPPLFALLGLIIAGDQLLWAVLPGIALPLFMLLVAALAHALSFPQAKLRTALSAWGLLCMALLPGIDQVQALSVAFALAGMLGFVGIMVGKTGRGAAFAALRFPVSAPLCIGADMLDMVRQPRGPSFAGIGASLRDWVIPAGLGVTFAALLLVANPVLEQWVMDLFSLGDLPLPSLAHLLFWIGLGLLIWPFLRLGAMRHVLTRPVPAVQAFGQVWYLSPRSVSRALILFNLLFAAQTATDLAIFWGGAALPEGMSYADYAHRGAYPLLFAALLAGGFALLTQPFLTGRPVLKALLLVWVVQTALLVASSMLRLDLYIEAYSLTRLRFAAFVWMGVVGGGLVLMLWQIIRGFGPGWLIMRASELGVITLYACSLINVDGLIARHNLLDESIHTDSHYICKLGQGAAPAIAARDAAMGWSLCGMHTMEPTVYAPSDWREWGYRNARLRSKLAQMTGASQ